MKYFGCILGVLVCFVIPLLGVLILQKKNKRIIKPFIIGILTFSISQLFLRLPIMHYVLPNYSWYLRLSTNTVLISLFAGITAGLFEEVGRYVSFKFFLKNNYRGSDGIAFGLGHGGIEAAVIVGINMIAMIIMMILGDASVLQVATGDIFLAVFERAFTIPVHIGLTMIVLRGFQTGKKLRYLLAAIIIHALIDSSIGILPLIISISSVGFEIVLAVAAALSIIYSIYVYKREVS